MSQFLDSDQQVLQVLEHLQHQIRVLQEEMANMKHETNKIRAVQEALTDIQAEASETQQSMSEMKMELKEVHEKLGALTGNPATEDLAWRVATKLHNTATPADVRDILGKLDAGADLYHYACPSLDAGDPEGVKMCRPIFHTLVARGCVDAVEAVLTHDRPVYLSAVDAEGCTPLHLLCGACEDVGAAKRMWEAMVDRITRLELRTELNLSLREKTRGLDFVSAAAEAGRLAAFSEGMQRLPSFANSPEGLTVGVAPAEDRRHRASALPRQPLLSHSETGDVSPRRFSPASVKDNFRMAPSFISGLALQQLAGCEAEEPLFAPPLPRTSDTAAEERESRRRTAAKTSVKGVSLPREPVRIMPMMSSGFEDEDDEGGEGEGGSVALPLSSPTPIAVQPRVRTPLSEMEEEEEHHTEPRLNSPQWSGTGATSPPSFDSSQATASEGQDEDGQEKREDVPPTTTTTAAPTPLPPASPSLSLALGQGQIPVVEELLSTSTPLDFTMENRYGSTPLHLLSYGGYPKKTSATVMRLLQMVVDRLASHPEDVVDWPKQDSLGHDALSRAASHGHLCVWVEVLFQGPHPVPYFTTYRGKLPITCLVRRDDWERIPEALQARFDVRVGM